LNKEGFIVLKNKDKLALCLTALIPLTLSPREAGAQLSIVVSASVGLNFGTFTAGPAGGTVVMTPSGARSVTGSVSLVGGAGLESPANFSVSGSTAVAMDVSVTSPAFPITNGTDTMTVNAFNLVADGAGPANTITLAANPSTFALGATLNVNAGQGSGVYVGNYVLSVNYQ